MVACSSWPRMAPEPNVAGVDVGVEAGGVGVEPTEDVVGDLDADVGPGVGVAVGGGRRPDVDDHVAAGAGRALVDV